MKYSGTKPSRYITTNGVDIYYEVYGKGDPLILLHGGLDNSRVWKPHIPLFSKYFKVFTPDSRGHGRTINPDDQLSYRKMAEDLAAFISALNLEDPMIFGYSDGGQITLDFGMRYSETPKALVIGGVWFKFSEDYQNALKSAGFMGPGELDYAILKKNWPTDYLERMRKNHPHPSDQDYWQKLLLQISRMWWRPLNYSVDDFRRIAAPTLILMGENDETIPVEEAHELSELIPEARLVIIPRATHNDVLKEGSSSIDIVLAFLLTHIG